MPRKVIRRTAPYAYTLQADRALPPEEQSRFHLRPALLSQRAVMQDDLAQTIVEPDGAHSVATRERAVAYAACLTNIVAIDNFPAGAPEPWPADRDARIAYLEGLGLEEIRELGSEIFAGSVQPGAGVS